MRRVLVVAYYFPPMGMSGVQRVAKLVKYLPEHGWQPTVLTVEPGGYFAYDPELLDEVEARGVEVVRTGSLDPTRLFGRRQTVSLPAESTRRRLAWLSQLLFVPDNKIGWFFPAVRTGRRLLQEKKFDAILSSAPPYTAHLVGARLSRWSGLPLVTDFRDDWVDNPRHVYPTPLHRAANASLERWVTGVSRISLVINRHIRDALRARTRGSAHRVEVLPQGFDPADFEVAPAPREPGKLRLLYSGVFYDVQTPDFFLRALARWVAESPERRRDVEAVFVGLVPDASRRLVEELGLGDVVRDAGYVSHREAVAWLRSADVLWMTVGRREGSEGISTGKLYEYMGARKPILALVPPGAVREALEPYGAAEVVDPEDVGGIQGALERLHAAWSRGALPAPEEEVVRRYDRRALAGEAARWLAWEGDAE